MILVLVDSEGRIRRVVDDAKAFHLPDGWIARAPEPGDKPVRWTGMGARYEMLDPEGNVFSTLMWDGATPFAIDPGYTLRLADITAPPPPVAAIDAPPPPPPPTDPGVRTVLLNGRQLQLRQEDALQLFGALAMAVDGETARITLASGDVLELTHQDVSDIGRQLAGKPADEVSGSDR